MDAASLSKHGIKPLIHEIVRTEVLFPHIRLLVEHLDVLDAEDDESGIPQQGFRIFLTDGEWCIQAVVRRRLHMMCLEADIGRGSVLHLKEYKLMTSERLDGKGEILHLALHDFYVIGYIALPAIELEDKLIKDDPVSEDMPPESISQVPEEFDQELAALPLDGNDPSHPVSGAKPASDGARSDEDLPSQPTRATSEHGDGKDRSASPLTDPEPLIVDEVTPQKHTTLPRNSEWIRRASIEHHQRCHLHIEVPRSERCPPTDDAVFARYCEKYPLANEGSACNSIAHVSLLAIMSGKPLKPFPDPPKVVSLASLTGQHKSRNHDVDVLAVIVHVDPSTSKPSRMPLKRDIRVQDPSVDEAVHLSVFVDPVNFQVSVGTIALFRHVTTNDWRTGTLNAYPARVSGREWFIPNPDCLGLREEVNHVASWWLLMQEQQSGDVQQYDD